MASEESLTSFPHLLVIYTGGTIGMKPTPRGYAPAPGYLTDLLGNSSTFHDRLSVDNDLTLKQELERRDNRYQEFKKKLESEQSASITMRENTPIPDITISNCKLSPLSELSTRYSFQVMEFNPLLDSSNMAAKEWRQIAWLIARNYEAFDGFVVLHGTDTMR